MPQRALIFHRLRIATIGIALLTGFLQGIKDINTYAGAQNQWEEISWSPNGDIIAVSTSSGSPLCGETNTFVYLIDANNQNVLQALEAGNCAIWTLDWNSDGTLLAGAGLGSPGFYIWDTNTGNVVADGGQGLVSIRWHPNLDLVAVTFIGDTGAIYDAESGSLVNHIYANGTSIDWNTTGEKLVIGSMNYNDISIVDGSTGDLETVLQGQNSPIYGVDWSPDGLFIASIEADNTVRVWSAAGNLVSSFTLNYAYRIRWSPDSQRIAAGGIDSLLIWDLASGQTIERINSSIPVNSFDWNPNSEQIAYGGSDLTGNPPEIEIVDVPVINEPPIANAGADQNVVDANNSGSELVTLHGEGSSDTDGTILSYIWTELIGGNVTQIATGAVPSVELPVGTHNNHAYCDR